MCTGTQGGAGTTQEPRRRRGGSNIFPTVRCLGTSRIKATGPDPADDLVEVGRLYVLWWL